MWFIPLICTVSLYQSYGSLEKDERGWHGIEKKEFERKLHSMKDFATPVDKYEEFSRSIHNGHHSDDGRCEGGTHFNGPPQRDKEQPTLQNDKHTTHHVRREHEPKGHVKTPKHRISREPKGDGHARIPQRNGIEPIPVTSSPTKNVTLDISNPNPSSIETLKRKPYGVDTRIYIAKSGRISSVVESGVAIWTYSDHSCEHVAVVRYKEGNCCSSKIVARLMVVYTMDNDGLRKPLYYAKDDGGKWNEIGEENFYANFHVGASKTSELGKIVISLNGTNEPKKFYTNNSPNSSFLVFAPNVGYRVTKVIWEKKCKVRRDDSMYYFWRSKSKTKNCIYASFYPRENHKVGYLIIDTPKKGIMEKYYVRNNGYGWAWKETTKDEYLKKLKEAGFNGSEFSNKIVLDVSQPDSKDFYTEIHVNDDRTTYLQTPLPGFVLQKVVDDTFVIWEAKGAEEKCIYANTGIKGANFTLYLFIHGKDNLRSILYFVKNDGMWINTDNLTHLNVITEREDPMYTHKGDGKLTMSSFRNKQGLKIATYASTLENPKADIILVHGARSHFMSDFCTSNLEWNYKHLGYQTPDTIGLFVRDNACRNDNVSNNSAKYRHIFEHAILEGKDAYSILPAYEYEGSFIEFLNKMGYNVYGLDLQSQGFSESQTTTRFYVNSFKDYIYDVMQFVNIIRRGKFGDASQVYDESTVLKSVDHDRKIILLGLSMGGNIIMQAVQEFHRHAEKGANFVDGIIGLSSMLNIDCNLNTTGKRIAKRFLWLGARLMSEKPAPHENLSDYGKNFDIFLRYRDPLFYVHGTAHNVLNLMFNACNDIKKDDNMAHYPKVLPTLFIHSKNDPLCDVKGPRKMMAKYFKGNQNVEFVELDGSVHYLTIPQSLSSIKPHLKKWLDKYT